MKIDRRTRGRSLLLAAALTLGACGSSSVPDIANTDDDASADAAAQAEFARLQALETGCCSEVAR